MLKSQSELRWHLSRSDEPSCLLTERELQQLIELGQLKETDLLWKPGLAGWQRADALAGVLMPPALPSEGADPSVRASLAGARRRVSGALKIAQDWTKYFRLILRMKRTRFTAFCAMQYEMLDAQARKATDQLQQAIASTKALCWMNQSAGIAILLGLTLIFGILNFAMQGFVVEAEEVSLIPRPTDSMSCPQLKKTLEISQPASDAKTFAGFALLTDTSVTSELDSGPIEPVPLPTRKPTRGSVEKSVHRAGREPRPMHFGSVGFAYDPQH